MKHVATVIIAAALALSAPSAYSWGSAGLADWWKDAKAGMKNKDCWATGMTFGAKKTDCDLF